MIVWVKFEGGLIIVDSARSWKMSIDVLRLGVCCGPSAYLGQLMYHHWSNYVDRETDSVITSDRPENSVLESNEGTCEPLDQINSEQNCYVLK